MDSQQVCGELLIGQCILGTCCKSRVSLVCSLGFGFCGWVIWEILPIQHLSLGVIGIPNCIPFGPYVIIDSYGARMAERLAGVRLGSWKYTHRRDRGGNRICVICEVCVESEIIYCMNVS